MITVLGASGNVGSKVAHAAIDSGQHVVVVGRDGAKLQKLGERGAAVRVGDISNTSWLVDALAGSDAVFAMQPSNPFAPDYANEQDRFGSSICAAITKNAISTVVALSSLGADRADAPGVIGALHRQERRLAALDADRVIISRPVSFFENFSPAVDQLTDSGTHVDSVRKDLPIPMIATADIAYAAVRALTDITWSGFAHITLLGQRDISYDEATVVLGEALGLDTARYQQLPYEAMLGVLTEIGLSADYARHYVEMTRAFNSGELTDPVARTEANTTTTRFEDFARSLAGRSS
ncbi:MAG: NAD(P)H-binding protein [Rhodococcus sp. (in: high G+C Gram-positive bacteria)]